MERLIFHSPSYSCLLQSSQSLAPLARKVFLFPGLSSCEWCLTFVTIGSAVVDALLSDGTFTLERSHAIPRLRKLLR
jgi:hypothetical protein